MKQKRKYGFITKNYKLMIEALAINEGYFVLTITRLLHSDSEHEKQLHKNKLKVRRKSVRLDLEPLIYSFNSFDDFLSFCEFLDNSKKFNNISRKNSLYVLGETYYLILKNIKSISNLKGFSSVINEFASYVKDSPLFERKLQEYGEVIIAKDAIATGIKHFV